MRLWPSSSKFPASKKLLEGLGLPFVVGVVFDEGAKVAGPLQGQPIKCGHCGAMLCDPSAVKEIAGVGPAWTCDFCGAVVAVVKGAQAGAHYRTAAKKPGLGPAVIGTIDISGSMSNGSLEAVKQSLLNTLTDLEANAPHTAFGLVAFESDVHVYGPKGKAVAVLRDAEILASEAAIREWGLSAKVGLEPVRKTGRALREAIGKLATAGSTALGPGLVVAGALLEKGGGEGRVILLTDGQANIGVGTLAGPSTVGKTFYSTLAARFEKQGVVVDVVAVAMQGTLELKTLAALPEVTGGELFYVDRTEVTGAFESLGAVRYVARHARLKVVLPRGVKAQAVSGLAPGTTTDEGLEFPLGSVAAGREVFVALEPEQTLEGERVPVQMQLRYRDEQGHEHVEVHEASLAVARQLDELSPAFDPAPSTQMEIQKGGEDAYLFNFDKAKERLVRVREKLAAFKQQASAAPSLERVAAELASIDEELEKRRSGSYYDSSSYASYSMTKRRSSTVAPSKKSK